jgi:hypothetical protein
LNTTFVNFLGPFERSTTYYREIFRAVAVEIAGGRVWMIVGYGLPCPVSARFHLLNVAGAVVVGGSTKFWVAGLPAFQS